MPGLSVLWDVSSVQVSGTHDRCMHFLFLCFTTGLLSTRTRLEMTFSGPL